RGALRRAERTWRAPAHRKRRISGATRRSRVRHGFGVGAYVARCIPRNADALVSRVGRTSWVVGAGTRARRLGKRDRNDRRQGDPGPARPHQSVLHDGTPRFPTLICRWYRLLATAFVVGDVLRHEAEHPRAERADGDDGDVDE